MEKQERKMLLDAIRRGGIREILIDEMDTAQKLVKAGRAKWSRDYYGGVVIFTKSFKDRLSARGILDNFK